MNTEYEVRVLDIDKEEIINKLKKLNATFKWEHVQRRYTYDFNPVLPNKWIRLRTNGTKSTITIKEIKSSNIDGTKELEIEVDDFDKANKLLEELGYKHRNFQENKRCQYDLNGVEIDIDDWPLIPTYLEIEGKSEEEVYKTMELLEIDKSMVTSKDVTDIYKDYGYDILKEKDLKLEEERL